MRRIYILGRDWISMNMVSVQEGTDMHPESLPPTAVPGPLQPVPAFRTADRHRPAVQEKESPRTTDAVRHRVRGPPPKKTVEACRTPSLRLRGEEGDGATAPPAAANAQRFNHNYQ
ncbi:unnamed protein product [Pleuronectes platessa]|uniref:Uncharacterized protein n=1 Tax=Pleuronectes platessa TaxID=8262 RepID=A0A9N7UMI8_PLEPL|nr:unnamed protein product [Pleuronectes platessa]